jgi:hypothetical protein
VKKGDYIGWKNLKSSDAPLSYITCAKKFISNYEDSLFQVSEGYKTETLIGKVESFKLMTGECRNYSLEAIVHPGSGTYSKTQKRTDNDVNFFKEYVIENPLH